MRIVKTEHGFEVLECEKYPQPIPGRLAGQSTVIYDYEDAMDRPGSSALWFANEFHLCREEVAELVERLQIWLATGCLSKPEERKS